MIQTEEIINFSQQNLIVDNSLEINNKFKKFNEKFNDAVLIVKHSISLSTIDKIFSKKN